MSTAITMMQSTDWAIMDWPSERCMSPQSTRAAPNGAMISHECTAVMLLAIKNNYL
uniref:Uncharacterized protein n=1 Tax=Rhizophora mucronata TaxID=61149 RepID=A0A2P2N0R1_RHIMU